MKSIGEILTAARKARQLSVAEVAKITKIEHKYIEALERNDFSALPAATFTKGFIRNYAQVVGKSPDEMIAVYRRDYAHNVPSPKTSLVKPNKSARTWLSQIGWGNLGIIAVGLSVFLLYLGFQYRALIIPPPLEIVQPTWQAVLTSPVMVEGKTSPDSLITINSSLELRPDSAGVFSTTLNLSPGEHEIQVRAVNRFNREKSITVPITVISGR
jgi:cytoskeletal protein RodZ